MKEDYLHAAINLKAILKLRRKRNLLCDIEIADSIFEDMFAFAVTKGSLWNEPIFDLLRMYKVKGTLDNIERKHMVEKSAKESSSQPKHSNLFYLSGACTMLVLGMVCSIVFFTAEHVISMCMNKCVRKKSSRTLSHEIDGKELDNI